MRRSLSWGILLSLALLLMSCVYHNGPGPNADLTCETWTREVDANPAKWTHGADRWFFEGGENCTEEAERAAPDMAAISTMKVRVPNTFTNVKVNGNFQVQIFGTNDCNSLYIYGPNSAVRNVVVHVTENTIYLSQAKNVPCDMRNVIIRIGIRNLNSLSQCGGGIIEGRGILSNCLSITSSGCGNIYLAGRVNLTRVVSTGSGNVNVFGAITPELDIYTSGAGSVNVSGNVGIHSITHHGCGNINIIGANTDGLKIKADGRGKIGINGRVAVDEINAKDHVCVYIYYLNGTMLNVYVTDYARVGLAGCTTTLYVDAGRSSRFEGHYLYTNDAFVRAHDGAHVNVTAANKLFASSTQNSSVYYFGSPNTLSQFFRESGVIIPILGEKSRYRRSYCPYYKRQFDYKDS